MIANSHPSPFSLVCCHVARLRALGFAFLAVLACCVPALAQIQFVRTIPDQPYLGGGPTGMEFDKDGNLWIAAAGGLVKIRPDGTWGHIRKGNDIPPMAFTSLWDVDSGPDGTVYVRTNDAIVKIPPGGDTAELVVGGLHSGNWSGFSGDIAVDRFSNVYYWAWWGYSGLFVVRPDGTRSEIGSSYPGTLEVDQDGNLWSILWWGVARRITPFGVETVFSVDSAGKGFNGAPADIAVSANNEVHLICRSGNEYVFDGSGFAPGNVVEKPQPWADTVRIAFHPDGTRAVGFNGSVIHYKRTGSVMYGTQDWGMRLPGLIGPPYRIQTFGDAIVVNSTTMDYVRLDTITPGPVSDTIRTAYANHWGWLDTSGGLAIDLNGSSVFHVAPWRWGPENGSLIRVPFDFTGQMPGSVNAVGAPLEQIRRGLPAYPQRMLTDRFGNLWSLAGNALTKVTPDGVATTRLMPWQYEFQLVAERDGGIIVSGRTWNSLQYRISPDGTASEVPLDRGIIWAIDEAGRIYVVEENKVIAAHHPDGSIERFGGSGSWPGRFVGDIDMALDGKGHLYVADTSAYRVHIFDVPNPVAPAPSTAHITLPYSNAHGWAKSNVLVKLVAIPSRSGVGVHSVHYTVDGSPEQSVAGPEATFTMTNEGETPISYRAVGYDGAQEMVHHQIVRIDKTVPTVDGTFDGNILKITTSDALSGVDYLEYQISKGTVNRVYATSADVGVPSGASRVSWWAFDKAGNRSDVRVQMVTRYLDSVRVEPEGGTPNVVGGRKADVVLNLGAPAPSGGIDIQLTSSQPNLFPVPATVTIPEGHQSIRVPVDAMKPVRATQVVLTAKQDTVEVHTSFHVVVLDVAAVRVAEAWESTTQTGRVHLVLPAPAGGVTLTLSSSNPDVVSVPSTVVVPEGSDSATFPAIFKSVDQTTHVSVTAAFDGLSAAGEAVVVDRRVTSLSVAPASVTGGNTVQVTVGLPLGAPTGGMKVQLTSSNPAVPVPATLTVKEGQGSASVVVKTQAVPADTTVTLGAKFDGKGADATLAVGRNRIAGFHATPTDVVGGNTSQLTIELSAPAAAGGIVIPLSSDNPALVVPATATVPAGSKTTTVLLKTLFVAQVTTVRAGANYAGDQPTATLTLQPNGLTNFTVTPDRMKGGLSAEGVLTIVSNAPLAGRVVSVESNHPDILVPDTVTVPKGLNKAAFVVRTRLVSQETTGQVTLRIDGTSLVRDVTLTPSSPLTGVSVVPAEFASGATVQIKVTKVQTTEPVDRIEVSGPFGTLAKADVPGSATEVVFDGVKITGAPGTGTVSATCLGTTITGTYKIKALRIATFTLSSATVYERRSVLGTIVLAAPAPAGGVDIVLSSDKAAVPTPPTVTVPGGSTTATVTLTSASVSLDTLATLRASGPGNAILAKLTVRDIVKGLSVVPSAAVPGTIGRVEVTKAATAFDLPVLTLEMADGSRYEKVDVAGGATTVVFDNVALSGNFGTKTARVTFEGEVLSSNYILVVNEVLRLAVTPTTVPENQSAQGTITLRHAAPPGGTVVSLASSSAAATVPATVTVAAGATQATFPITTSSVTAAVKATLTATLDGQSVTGAVTVQNITVATKTTVTFSPVQTKYTRGTTITVLAKVVDAKGVALSGRSVTFVRYLNLTQSPLVLGTATTNASGVASLNYTIPTDPLQDNIVIQAVYDGNPDPILNGASSGSKRIPIALN